MNRLCPFIYDHVTLQLMVCTPTCMAFFADSDGNQKCKRLDVIDIEIGDTDEV